MADSVKVFSLKRFLGLNESRDGDTQLRMGEASEMDNWRVTPQYHLRVRPGLKTVWSFQGPVRGLWAGRMAGEERLVCAALGMLWSLERNEAGAPVKRFLGMLTDAPTSFFGFGGKLYILNGHEYLCWDGTQNAAAVAGYVPLVATAASPAGGGTPLEPVNRLTPMRRVRFSGDGAAKVYHLPEKNLALVDRVLVEGEDRAGWTADTAAGTVTLPNPPGVGVNNVEIWYSASESLRAQVTAMRFAETYNGSTDTRVFLYGDGTNKTIYSGLTEDGVPTAEYFPDMNEIAVDSKNTPVTGMMKQFSYLLIFKSDGAFSTQYAPVTLQDGSVTAGFYVCPVNREIGNEAMGQVRAVYNDPRTLYAGNVYDWQMSSTGRDERRAQLMSERVAATLHRADLSKVFCFDNEREQEYYIFLNDEQGTALVHRYQYQEGDVWYRYTGLPAVAAARQGETVYLGLRDGRVCAFSQDCASDDGAAIPCLWKSGDMDFGADCRRKSAGRLWVSLKPDSSARVTVTAQTDRRSAYTVRWAASALATCLAADFRHWSFLTNRNPQIQRVKLKVKRFAFYKLLLACCENSATTTVLGVDMRVRYAGYVK